MIFPYVYDDEDNVSLIEDRCGHNPTVYADRATMKAWEHGEPEPKAQKPEDGCWNCMNFDWKHEACTVNWNNMDESYYNPDIDDRKLTDYCEYHDPDPDVDPADCFDFGGNEP